MPSMKFIVDRERCTGHGRCYTVAPEVYAPDDDGYCDPAVDAVAEGLEEQARLGAMNCPEDAITIIKHQGDSRE